MLAVVGLAAATCSPALAESGAPDVPLPAVPDLAAAAATVLDDTTLQEVLPAAAAAGLPELETVAAPPTTLPAVPAQETAAEPVTGAVVAPPQEPVPPVPAAAPEPDSPSPDAPPASVDQTDPTNVNISVRIDSPGDNGSVDQVNAADADAVSQPDDPQDQAQPGESTAAPAAATPEAPAPADASGWEWNWSWNCADPVPELPATPSGSMQNWTWNWDWDCGAPGLPDGNTSSQSGGQYQPGVSQYRPVNINISIRINSPGNDGPVRQTNIASATTTFVLPTIRIDASAAPVAGIAAAGAGPALVIAASMPVAESVQAEMPAPLLEFLFGALSDQEGCCPPPLPLGVPYGAPEPSRPASAPAPDATARDITAPARFRASVELTMRLTRASAEAAREARAASKPARTVRPAPRSRAAEGTREPAVVLGSGFAPPLNASDGRLGYLFLFVAGIAFVFAFADATRSVAADVRATGEDPDPPPDRPG
jgi:hypothetical protein